MARLDKTIQKSNTIRTKNGTLDSSSKLQVFFYKSSLGAGQSLVKELGFGRAQNDWRRNQVGSVGLANRDAFGEEPARWIVGNSNSTCQSNCKSSFCDVRWQHCVASRVY